MSCQFQFRAGKSDHVYSLVNGYGNLKAEFGMQVHQLKVTRTWNNQQKLASNSANIAASSSASLAAGCQATTGKQALRKETT
jgi:hypothetical protein